MLTPDQERIGRRNFLKALAGTPAPAALGAATVVKGPVRGGPVQVGFIGIGAQSLAKADEVLAGRHCPPARHYVEWRDMLAHHVLCEKMMAWDAAGCDRMLQAAVRNNRILEIGYQRWYNPVYQAADEGVVKAGLLGDVYHTRLVWHRNQNWRRPGDPPSRDYDASKWGYPTWDHLWNWFHDAVPTAVQAAGGLYRFKDGRREVCDHVYATPDAGNRGIV